MNHFKQITILSIAVAVLFVSVLYLLYLNFHQAPAAITSPPKTGVIPTSDPTADWKTYTSSKFNYSFKYPQNWFIFDFDNTGRMVKISSQEMSAEPCGMGPCYENSIEFNLTDKPPLEVQVNDPVGTKKNEMMAQGDYVVKTQDLTVGGKTSARMEIRSTGNNYVAYWYEIDLGQKKVMKISNSEQDPITLSVLNQILSTFNFTQNIVTPTNIPTKILLKPSPTVITEKINTSFSCGTYSGTNYPPKPAFGPNPLVVSLSPSGGTSTTIGLVGFQWDYLGNGSWNSSIVDGPTSFTYTQNGTFIPKFRVKGSDGSFGPTCSYPFSVVVGTPVEFSNDIISVNHLNLNITISRTSHNYNFVGSESNFNDGGSRIFAPGFSVSSKGQFTAVRSTTPYNSSFGVYETGFDMDKGTSGVFHLFIDKNKANGTYDGEYIITYTTDNGTVTHNGPTVKYKITLTD